MFKQRVLTALVLAPVVLCGLFLLSGAWFALFGGLVTVLGAWEWARLAGWPQQGGRIGYAVAVALLLWLLWHLQPARWLLLLAALWWLFALMLVIRYPASAQRVPQGPVRALAGLCILLPTWQALVTLKGWPSGNWLILSVLLLVWAADIGAYFAGRAWGKHKLAPKVSPGKSWQGFWCGLVAALVVYGLLLLLLGQPLGHGLPMLLGAALVTVMSVLGDLTESLFKREVGLKDSSQLLPGHGGILDRIDSLTAALPVYTLLLWVCGWRLL